MANFRAMLRRTLLRRAMACRPLAADRRGSTLASSRARWPRCVLLITLMVWGTMRSMGGDGKGLGLSSDTIAVIDIAGVILSPETVDNQLRKFGDDSSVKAIILHINSPGGGAAASQEIYHEVLARAAGEAQEGHRLDRVGGGLGRVLHRQRVRQDLCERRVGGGVDRRDHGVDQLWRSDALGQAEERGHPRRRVEGRRRPEPRPYAERAGVLSVAGRQHVHAVCA